MFGQEIYHDISNLDIYDSNLLTSKYPVIY